MKQFNIVIILTVFILLLNTNLFFAQDINYNENEKNQSEITEDQDSNFFAAARDEIIYQCPIDFEVLSNVPGYCSKCEVRLKEYTLEEVINNLNEDGHKKPTLVIKMMNIGKEEITETVDTATVQDTTGLNERIAAIDFLEIDHNEDGMVFQCPVCPEQIWDDVYSCAVCGSVFIEYTIEEVKANLRRGTQTEKQDEKEIGLSSSQK